MDHVQYLSARKAAASNEETRERLFSEATKRENDDRAYFARARDGWEVLGREDLSTHPHPSLIPVYSATGQVNAEAFAVDPRGAGDSELAQRVFVLDPKERDGLAGKCAVVPSLADFKTNFFDVFCEGQLRYLNWDNVFAAGGCILACASPLPAEHAQSMHAKRKYFHDVQYGASDVDLFLYGLDEAQARAKLVEIYKAVSDACPFQVVCFRSAHAVTLVSQYPCRHIQIVLRLYSSPYEVLAGFDVDSCTMGFDGKMVYADVRAHHALVTRRNTIDLTRRSPSYEIRLAKYGERGFEVQVPSLQRSRVDPAIFERPWHALDGLAKLLVLERLRTPESRHEHFERQKLARTNANAHFYVSSRTTRLYGFRQGLDLSNQQRLEERFGGTAEASNYSTVFLPWGPYVTVNMVMKLMARKDYMLNNRWFSRGRAYRLHPCFFGTAEEILEDCSPDDPPFPEKPQAGEDDDEPVEEEPLMKEHRETYVRGPLTFIKDNPGRQRIGSFHPLDEAGWTDGVYFVGTTDELFTAVNANDAKKLKEVLGRVKNALTQRDFFGRTLIQVGIMAKAKDAVQCLLDAGANPMEPMAGRRTCFHLVAMYDQAALVPHLFAAAEKMLKDKATEEKAAKKALKEWVRALEDDHKISAVLAAVFLGNYAVVDELCKVGASLTSEEFPEAPNYDPLRLLPMDETRLAKGIQCIVRNGYQSTWDYGTLHRLTRREGTGTLDLIAVGHPKALRILLENDPSALETINLPTMGLNYPLGKACEVLSLECLEILLEYKAQLVPSLEIVNSLVKPQDKNSNQSQNYLRLASSPSYPLEKAVRSWCVTFQRMCNQASSSRSSGYPLADSTLAIKAIENGIGELGDEFDMPKAVVSPPVTFDDSLAELEKALTIVRILLDHPDTRLTTQSYHTTNLPNSTVGDDLLAQLDALTPSIANARTNYIGFAEANTKIRLIEQAMDSLLVSVESSKYLHRMVLHWKLRTSAMKSNKELGGGTSEGPNPDETLEQNLAKLEGLRSKLREMIQAKIQPSSRVARPSPPAETKPAPAAEAVVTAMQGLTIASPTIAETPTPFSFTPLGSTFATTVPFSFETGSVENLSRIAFDASVGSSAPTLPLGGLFGASAPPVPSGGLFGTSSGMVGGFQSPSFTGSVFQIRPDAQSKAGSVPSAVFKLNYARLPALFGIGTLLNAFPTQKPIREHLASKPDHPDKVVLASFKGKPRLNVDTPSQAAALEAWIVPAMERQLFLRAARRFSLLEASAELPIEKHMAYCELFEAAMNGRSEDLWPLCQAHDLSVAVSDAERCTLLHMAVARNDAKLFQEVIRIAELQYTPPEEATGGRKMIAKKPPRRIDNIQLMDEMEFSGGDDDEEGDEAVEYAAEDDEDDEEEGDEDKASKEAKPKAPPAKGATKTHWTSIFTFVGTVECLGSSALADLESKLKEASVKFPEWTMPKLAPYVSTDILRLAILLGSMDMFELVLKEAARLPYSKKKSLLGAVNSSGILGSANCFTLAVLLDKPAVLLHLMQTNADTLGFDALILPFCDPMNYRMISLEEFFDEDAAAATKKTPKKKSSVSDGYQGIMTSVYGAKKNQLEEEKRSGSAATIEHLPRPMGPTLMHVAAAAGSVECYKLLVDSSPASPWIRLLEQALETKHFARFREYLAGLRSRTPLAFKNELASQTVHGDALLIARYLIGGSDLLHDQMNQTPLHRAVQSRTLFKLLKNGVVFSEALLKKSYEEIPFDTKVQFKDSFQDGRVEYTVNSSFPGKSPLTIASERGYYEEVEVLITKLGLDPNVTDAFSLKRTPFLSAIANRRFKTAGILARYSKPETLLKADALGRTALMHCATADDLDFLITTVEQCPGVDKTSLVKTLDVGDAEGRTALHLTATNLNTERPVTILIAWNASAESKRSWMLEDHVSGRTPLDLTLDTALSSARSSSSASLKSKPGFKTVDVLVGESAHAETRVRAEFEDVRPARERKLDALGSVLGVDEEVQRLAAVQRNMDKTFAHAHAGDEPHSWSLVKYLGSTRDDRSVFSFMQSLAAEASIEVEKPSEIGAKASKKTMQGSMFFSS